MNYITLHLRLLQDTDTVAVEAVVDPAKNAVEKMFLMVLTYFLST